MKLVNNTNKIMVSYLKVVIVQRSGQTEDSILQLLSQWEVFDVRTCEDLREVGRKMNV